MSSSWLATLLDQEQIERLKGEIAPRTQEVESMPSRTGKAVAKELGSRYVVRYLGVNRLNDIVKGSKQPQWVTPTPISPEDAAFWLALPDPHFLRKHAVLLDLRKIKEIRGPAWIKLGQGIEYYLPDGFPKSAVVDKRFIEIR